MNRTKNSPLRPALGSKPTKVLSSRQVKSKHQEAALQLLKREETKGMKSRMECLLIQQYVKKHGTKQTNSKINNYIKSAVKEFLEGLVNINQAESKVEQLEAEIKQTVDTMKMDTRTEKQAQKVEQARANSRGDAMQLSLTGVNLAANTATQQSQSSPLLDVEENQWPVINAILAVDSDERQRKEKEKARIKLEKYQHDIALQLEQQKQRDELKKREKEQAAAMVNRELSSYEQDKLQQKRKQEEKFKHEREIRLAQIEENKRMRDLERQQKIAIEQMEIQRAKQLALVEEQRKQEQKEREKLAQERLLIENERNKAMKEAELRKIAEHDMKMNKEYEAKLAREEAARQAAFQARMDALQNFSKGYEARVGARLQEQKAAVEKKEHSALLEAERLRAEKEDADKARKRQALLQSTEYNIRMMEEKKRAKDQERLDNIERRRRMEADAAVQKRLEREAAEEKRLRMIELKRNLDSQVQQQRRGRGRQEMNALSGIELEMNKSLIKKLHEDPSLAVKVQERVHPAHQVLTSRSNTSHNIFG